eukprot:g231.t1
MDMPNNVRGHHTVMGLTNSRIGEPSLIFTVVDGACKASDFLTFMLSDDVLGSIMPGDVVVLDNARTHHAHGIPHILQRAFEMRQAFLVFLPPYSPQLNPIEIIWANMKKRLRYKLPLAVYEEDVEYYACVALSQTSQEEVSAAYRKCGYRNNFY